MRHFPRLTASVTLFFALATGFSQAIRGRSGITLPPPPEVQSTPVTDDYFGTKIVDNYRWLEDEKSDATQAFIDAENTYTDEYLHQDRIYPQIPDQLGALMDVTVTRSPVERNGTLFFMRRLAGEQQFSIYVRHGLTGKDERILDPAVISRDPNTSISLGNVSRDGSLFIYSEKQGGADETSIHVFAVKARKTLVDELPSARYFSESFAPDGKSFYYARYSRQGTLLYQHVLGERPVHDQLIFGHEFRGEPLAADDLFFAQVTDDGRYLVIQIDRGVPARRVDIVFRDLTKKDSYFDILVWDLDARFSAIYANGAWYVKTDYKSPMGRILKADPGVMPEAWTTIVPEGKEVIDQWAIVGGKIFVNRLKDVKPETSIYTLDGKPAGQLAYNGIGSASILSGRTTDRYGYFEFSSFIVPPTLYRLDTLTGKKEVFFQPKIPFDSSQYELKQVFYESKDGTRVPMFIAGKKGLKQDGSERLLMTGYGGFNLSLLATWNPEYAWWLEQGGWFALPSLRGGGEYGEQWHEQGMFEKKQNVFDDWFAAARYLIDKKYSSAAHFAIIGRSNGGLLMGASIVQHPELFAAVECGYPLLDMLRYQKFKIGSFWVTEYGSADNEKQFPYLLKYSPYQNVKVSDAYPAVLFFTGDSDTRVDPLHARKMTALLQSASKSGRPILLHYGRGGGHSAGVSIDQEIDDYSMELAFLWTETGQQTTQK
ncbi:MAG TPA: prolyl oligopeptidase family serine peptidase [Terracidiphilus sp.]|nr:prolyl oligopeptidase family serine peptidase [Terracidiphilus sp.]